MATSLNNLGDLARAQNRNDEARRQYDEALRINSELAKADPGAYLPEVATTLNNLGNLSRDEPTGSSPPKSRAGAKDLRIPSYKNNWETAVYSRCGGRETAVGDVTEQKGVVASTLARLSIHTAPVVSGTTWEAAQHLSPKFLQSRLLGGS